MTYRNARVIFAARCSRRGDRILSTLDELQPNSCRKTADRDYDSSSAASIVCRGRNNRPLFLLLIVKL